MKFKNNENLHSNLHYLTMYYLTNVNFKKILNVEIKKKYEISFVKF
mgnify:CR=1 FL=1